MIVSLRRIAIGFCALSIFPCMDARAAVVDPTRSNTAVLSGTTTALRPELVGMVLSDSTQAFEIKNTSGDVLTGGTLRQQVIRENGAKTLDFYYQLTNTSGSHSLGSLLAYGFQSGKLDMDFLSDASASSARPKSGSVLGVGGSIASFNFDDGIAPGQTTAPLFVHTHSTAFVTDDAGIAIVFANRQPGDSDLDNLISSSLSIARPVPAPIPLPPAIFASLTVLLPVGGYAFWRKRTGERTLM